MANADTWPCARVCMNTAICRRTLRSEGCFADSVQVDPNCARCEGERIRNIEGKRAVRAEGWCKGESKRASARERGGGETVAENQNTTQRHTTPEHIEGERCMNVGIIRDKKSV